MLPGCGFLLISGIIERVWEEKVGSILVGVALTTLGRYFIVGAW